AWRARRAPWPDRVRAHGGPCELPRCDHVRTRGRACCLGRIVRYDSVVTPVRKAVFPAAGLGTRFLPVTKAQPKEMLPLVDKPIIQYGVEEAVGSGVSNIILVTGRGKNAIE